MTKPQIDRWFLFAITFVALNYLPILCVTNAVEAGNTYNVYLPVLTITPTADVPVIIYYGDSMTYGTGGNYPYSHWIAAKTYGGQMVVQTTSGLGGATLVDLYDAVAANVNGLFAPRSGMNIVVLWGGVNDIFADQGADIPGVLSNLQDLASRLRRIGFKVIVCTIPANGGGITYATYDALIRASWMNFADGLADLAANPIIGIYNSFEIYPAYWADDHIHQTDLGQQVSAGIIEAQIDKILSSEPKK